MDKRAAKQMEAVRTLHSPQRGACLAILAATVARSDGPKWRRARLADITNAAGSGHSNSTYFGSTPAVTQAR
jgi:hypothetical protein